MLIRAISSPGGSSAVGVGWLWTRRADTTAQKVEQKFEAKNPLELLAAFLFAGLFLAMLVATHLAVTYLGQAGVNTLAAIMGVTDVDPFIMGMTQTAGSVTPLKVAAARGSYRRLQQQPGEGDLRL